MGYEYVTKKGEKRFVKKNLLTAIYELQDEVRDYFTFQFRFVGSGPLNMVTCDFSRNKGFDFDVDIYVNDEDENFTPEEIRKIIRMGIDNVSRKYGYDFCEDSTRVLTIKVKDTNNSKILHSCDFAIVYLCGDGRKQYIRYDKKKNRYTWEYSKEGYELEEKIEWLKNNGLWNKTRDYYINKKDANFDNKKHSCSLRAEAINEMCVKFGYNK